MNFYRPIVIRNSITVMSIVQQYLTNSFYIHSDINATGDGIRRADKITQHMWGSSISDLKLNL